MVSEYMELCFNTETDAFKNMIAILALAMFREKMNDYELHHIVPITWFAQNDEERPAWASVHDWGKLIRNSTEHPANSAINLVYLTADEHNEVHELMKQCWASEDTLAPSKGCGKFQRIDVDTDEVLQEYDSVKNAMNWLRENNYTNTNWLTHLQDAIRTNRIAYGFKWVRVNA